MTNPASRARRSTSPNRSGCRGARIASAPGDAGLHARERAQHRAFLAAHRAARDDDLPRRRHAEEPQHPLARLAVRGRGRQLQRIELQAAGHRDARRIGAEIDQPPRRFLALHAEAIDVGEHAAEERTDQPVARIRSRRDAAVDHDRLHAALAAHAQQVRPDLGLHHDEDARLDQIERAPDDERPVEREVEHAVDVLHAVPRHLLAGDRRRREEQTEARIARSCRSAASARAVSVSPTDTAWIQIDSSPSMLNVIGRKPEPLAAGCRCTSCSESPGTGSTARRARRRPASAGCKRDTCEVRTCRS